MKRCDSIVKELHELRERIGRAHDFDADRIAVTIRRHEEERDGTIVQLTPKRAPRQKRPRSRRRPNANALSRHFDFGDRRHVVEEPVGRDGPHRRGQRECFGAVVRLISKPYRRGPSTTSRSNSAPVCVAQK